MAQITATLIAYLQEITFVDPRPEEENDLLEHYGSVIVDKYFSFYQLIISKQYLCQITNGMQPTSHLNINLLKVDGKLKFEYPIKVDRIVIYKMFKALGGDMLFKNITSTTTTFNFQLRTKTKSKYYSKDTRFRVLRDNQNDKAITGYECRACGRVFTSLRGVTAHFSQK